MRTEPRRGAEPGHGAGGPVRAVGSPGPVLVTPLGTFPAGLVLAQAPLTPSNFASGWFLIKTRRCCSAPRPFRDDHCSHPPPLVFLAAQLDTPR